MIKKMRAVTVILALGAAAATTLSGCSGDSTLSIHPDMLAQQVADALAESVGSATPPNVDCGEDEITPANGLVVMCVLSVDGDEPEYDVTVTFDSVEGNEYHFNSQVAAEPRE